MDIIDDKMEEAKKYRRTKNKGARMKLRKVSIQVKIAKDSELADFIEHLMYEVAQLCREGWMVAEESGRVDQFKMPKYEERADWKTLENKEAQLDAVKIEVNIRRSEELGMVAEGTVLKRKVHRAGKERERILRGQEDASQALQEHVDVLYEQSSSRCSTK